MARSDWLFYVEATERPAEHYGSVDDDMIVKAVVNAFEHSKSSRSPIEDIWNENFNLYNNRYDFSRKESWQHKVWIPRFSQAVEAIAAQLAQSSIDAPDFADIQPQVLTESSDRELKLANQLTSVLKLFLEANNFREIFAEALKGALLTGWVIAKVYWGVIGSRHQSLLPSPLVPTAPFKEGPVIQFISPYDIYIDPSGRNKFLIHRVVLDKEDALKLADMGLLDRSKVEKLEHYDTSEEVKSKSRSGIVPVATPKYRTEVEILEYYGVLYNPTNGQVIEENVRCIIGNRKFVLRRPEPIPFPLNRAPFIIGYLVPRPFSVYPRTFMEDARGNQQALVSLINLVLDAAYYASIRAFVADPNMFYDIRQLQEGIYPGKVFLRVSGEKSPIEAIQLGTIDPMLLTLVQWISSETLSSSGISEVNIGMLPLRGRHAATTVVAAQRQASIPLMAAVRCLEKTFLKPLLWWMSVLFFANKDTITDRHLLDVLNKKAPDLMQLSDEEAESIYSSWRFEARGISSTLSRIQEINKIMQLLQLAASDPMLGAMLNREELLKRLLFNMGIDTQNVLKPLPQNIQQLAMIQSALAGGRGRKVDLNRIRDIAGLLSGEIPEGGEELPDVGNMARFD